VLTTARRNALEKLRLNVLQSYKRPTSSNQQSDVISRFPASSVIPKEQIPFSPSNEQQQQIKPLLSVEVSDTASLFLAARNGADIIYLPVHCFDELSQDTNHEALQEIKTKGIELVLITPQIAHDHELEAMGPLFTAVQKAGYKVACSDLGSAQLAKGYNIPFVAQKEFNVFNSYTALLFFSSGACRVTLSSELNLEEIGNICRALQASKHSGQSEVVIHGRELMLITKNDLLGPVAARDLLSENSEAYLEDQQVISSRS
jgi:putative protease